jgi:ankyrin repeat protein
MAQCFFSLKGDGVLTTLQTVLAGETMETKITFFECHGTTSTYAWKNQEALQAWAGFLQRKSKDYEDVLGLISSMTQETPSSRPVARELMESIVLTATKRRSFCGSCCAPQISDDEGTSYCGSGSESDDAYGYETAPKDTTASREENFETAPAPNHRYSLPSGPDVRKAYQASCITVADDQQDGEARSQEQRRPRVDVDSNSTTLVSLPESPASSSEGLEFQEFKGGCQATGCSPQPTEPVGLPRSQSLSRDNRNSVTATSHVPPGKNGRRGATNRIVEPLQSMNHQDATRYFTAHAVGPSSADGEDSEKFRRETVSKLPTGDSDSDVDGDEDSPAPQEEEEDVRKRLAGLFERDDIDLAASIAGLRRADPTMWKQTVTEAIAPTARSLRKYTLLHYVVWEAEVGIRRDLAEHLIGCGAKVKAKNVFGFSPLHFAAGDATMTEYLLRCGADPKQTSLTGHTALHLSARYDDEHSTLNLCKYNPGIVNKQDNEGRTALHWACECGSPETIQVLFDAGADHRIADATGKTALDLCHSDIYEAVYSMSIEAPAAAQSSRGPLFRENGGSDVALRGVLCYCAYCSILRIVEPLKDREGHDILTCRCSYHLDQLSEELLWDDKAMDRVQNCTCETCCAARDDPCDAHEPGCMCDECFPWRFKGHGFYSDMVLNAAPQGDNTNRTWVAGVLERAGFSGRKSYTRVPDAAWIWTMDNMSSLEHPEDFVAVLFECGANTETVGPMKLTFLQRAVLEGNLPLASTLISRGANINAQRQGPFKRNRVFTPLLQAVFGRHAAIAWLLLQYGALPNSRDSTSPSALHAAASVAGNWEVLAVLLAHARDVDALDWTGATALQYAIAAGNWTAVVLLLEAEASPELAVDGRTPLLLAIEQRQMNIAKLLIEHGANVHAQFGTASCALIRAAQIGDGEMVCSLLLNSEEVARDIHMVEFGTRRTALHLLANSTMFDIEIGGSTLVQYGANVDALDGTGCTPMHMAAEAGYVQFVYHLMMCGADPNIRDDCGRTPLDLAQANQHKEMVELLGGTLEKKKKKKWYQLGK